MSIARQYIGRSQSSQTATDHDDVVIVFRIFQKILGHPRSTAPEKSTRRYVRIMSSQKTRNLSPAASILSDSPYATHAAKPTIIVNLDKTTSGQKSRTKTTPNSLGCHQCVLCPIPQRVRRILLFCGNGKKPSALHFLFSTLQKCDIAHIRNWTRANHAV